MSRWGEEKTLLFVSHYRSYECLWNTHSPLYKNNIARNNAYEALLKDMNDSSLTMKIIKTKIKNLRSVYHAEVRKINSSKRSGAGAADVYKPPMSWFTEMNSFMADTDDYRETIESDLVETDTSTQDSESIPTPPPPTLPPPTPPQSASISEESRPSDDYSGRRKKVKKIGETVGVAEALNRLQNISSAINNRNAEDEFHFFGMNVASQLRRLPLYEALGVQNEIQAILTTARRRNMYPNLSVLPNSNKQTYNYSPLNIQPITSTLSASNTQTNILQSSNIQSITSTLPTHPASNTQTYNYSPSNLQPITSTLPASKTQTNILQSSNSHIMLSYSNIQPDTCASNYSTLSPLNIQNDADTPNAHSQQGHAQIDLLSEAWKLS